MNFNYFGHSCFSIESNGKKILFDPFISGNELAKEINIQTIEADYIVLSHGHADHIADCEAIAHRTGAKVICNWEIHEWLQAKGIHNTHPMNTGGERDFEDFKIKCVVAQHSSSLPDGSYGGNPMGFIIYSKNINIYYSGDTALTLDMQLVPLFAKIDYAILPIGDNFTMGVSDAIRCAHFVKTNKIIGVHFDTFGYIVIDKQNAITMFKNDNLELILPVIGSTIQL